MYDLSVLVNKNWDWVIVHICEGMNNTNFFLGCK